MNIIAIMGPHGVFYKDEPIKELESALVAQGFQIIWPQNSVDLLKFIEHNPRICGVIFDWDEYSLDLCSDINQLNEYLPLYAFINTHSTMDVSVQDMRMALWFFEYALGQAEDIAIRMRQYTDDYAAVHESLVYLRQRAEVHLLYAGAYGRHRISKKPGWLPVL